MQLHTLPKFKTKRVQRVGRGGKRGTFSGRGTKGQKSRAGRRIRPAGRDLIIRIPKRRGFRNKPVHPKPLTMNVSDLSLRAKSFLDGSSGMLTIDSKTLIGLGFVPPRYRGRVKVLAKGNISHPLLVRGFQVSASAKEKIEKAGGRVE